MSHHPCWRQEEQIPSGTPKLVRHPCFWKTPTLFHVPGSSDSPSLEQRGVESSLNWCPGGANVFGEAALETGWVTGDCADTAAVWLLGALGSGVGRNPLSLLLFEPLSGILADWSCWGVDSHYSPVFLREQLQNYSLLGFLEGFCLAAGTTLAVPSSGGLWSPGLLLDFEQQTCPAATCQENHLWSHLQTVDDLEVSAVEGWGQAWSGVPLQAGKWDLSRPAGVRQVWTVQPFWNVPAVTAGHIAPVTVVCSLSSLLKSSFFGEISSVWLTFSSCRIHSDLVDSPIHWKSFLLFLIYYLYLGERRAQCEAGKKEVTPRVFLVLVNTQISESVLPWLYSMQRKQANESPNPLNNT